MKSLRQDLCWHAANERALLGVVMGLQTVAVARFEECLVAAVEAAEYVWRVALKALSCHEVAQSLSEMTLAGEAVEQPNCQQNVGAWVVKVRAVAGPDVGLRKGDCQVTTLDLRVVARVASVRH